MMKRLAVIALAAGFALGGCSSTTPASPAATVTATATTTTTAQPAGVEEITPGSLGQLAAFLSTTGVPCTDYTVLVEGTSAKCSEMVMYWGDLSTAKTAKAFYASVDVALADLIKDARPDGALLVGQGWMVRVTKAQAQTLQPLIGGKILTNVAS